MAPSRIVALRKESVDRNITALAVLLMYSVALRKESVDRNIGTYSKIAKDVGSLSARRAWIEILMDGGLCKGLCVALRKESVDRNTNFSPASLFDLPSLSARRAWIEIPRARI